MKRVSRVLLLLLLPLLSAMGGSTLELYRDGAVYRYIPVDDYVGFLSGGEAKCGEKGVALEHRGSCPEAKRLCKERLELEKSMTDLRGVEENLRILEGMEKQVKPTDVSADKWAAAAEKLGKRHAELRLSEEEMKLRVEALRERFSRQSSSDEALFLSRGCKGELELTMPPGLIDLWIENEAELDGEKGLTIRHYLVLRNHSGVEISVKDARIYARNRRIRLAPIDFRPWIVRPAPLPAESGRKAFYRRMERGVKVNEAMIAPVPEASAKRIRKIGDRNYAVGKLELPSTGEEIRIKLSEYRADARCGEVAYPYRDLHCYRVCRFHPKEEIVSDDWLIRDGRQILSDHAKGRYEKDGYLLYVERDDSVTIRRRPLVEKERSSGIFGGQIRRKDGFVLTLVNASGKPKDLTLIERIPRSTTEKIEVKLLKVEGGKKLSLDKEGKLTIAVRLAPEETRTVKVLFDLRYDKDLKIVY
ncbi:DUF4139 domain-containing protein [Nitratifractor sp.]